MDSMSSVQVTAALHPQLTYAKRNHSNVLVIPAVKSVAPVSLPPHFLYDPVVSFVYVGPLHSFDLKPCPSSKQSLMNFLLLHDFS